MIPMKNTKIHLLKGALIALPLLFGSGCSTVGLYSEGQVEDIGEQLRQRGYDDAVAQHIRVQEHQRQSDAAGKLVREEYHMIHVPAHMNEQGVKITAHHLPIKVLVEQ